LPFVILSGPSEELQTDFPSIEGDILKAAPLTAAATALLSLPKPLTEPDANVVNNGIFKSSLY
jgi:hypothetical protein